MKIHTLFISLGLGLGLGLSLALPSVASEDVSATSVADFDNSVSDIKLLRHHFQAFAVMVNSDNQIDVYRADRQGDTWSQLPAESPSIENLPDNAEGLDGIRVYNRSLHLLVDTEAGPELWSIKLHGRPTKWKNTGEAGLGVDATDATHIFNQYMFPVKNNKLGSLIVATVVDGQAQLVAYEDGDWSTLGEAGLGQAVASVTSSAHILIDETHYILLGTDTGKIYKSPADDLTTWEEFADATDEITAMRTYKGVVHIATKTDDGVSYMIIDKAATEVTEPDTEPYFSTSDEITGFRTLHPGAPLYALVRDADTGASLARYNYGTSEWTEVIGEGLGDTDNTNITSFIDYHGKRYAATNGENQIYRLSN